MSRHSSFAIQPFNPSKLQVRNSGQYKRAHQCPMMELHLELNGVTNWPLWPASLDKRSQRHVFLFLFYLCWCVPRFELGNFDFAVTIWCFALLFLFFPGTSQGLTCFDHQSSSPMSSDLSQPFSGCSSFGGLHAAVFGWKWHEKHQEISTRPREITYPYHFFSEKGTSSSQQNILASKWEVLMLTVITAWSNGFWNCLQLVSWLEKNLLARRCRKAPLFLCTNAQLHVIQHIVVK